jgi:hypothetical protein
LISSAPSTADPAEKMTKVRQRETANKPVDQGSILQNFVTAENFLVNFYLSIT